MTDSHDSICLIVLQLNVACCIRNLLQNSVSRSYLHSEQRPVHATMASRFGSSFDRKAPLAVRWRNLDGNLHCSLTLALALWLMVGAARAAGDEFFARSKAHSMCANQESVRKCLDAAYDQLDETLKSIDEARSYLRSHPKLHGFETELVRLHALLDKRAGYESVVTHLLREDCGTELESGWNEQDCIGDLQFVPEFKSVVADMYVARIKRVAEDEQLLLTQEERVAHIIYLHRKLMDELNKQIEQRHDIKAGHWIDQRYLKRRLSTINLTAAFENEESS